VSLGVVPALYAHGVRKRKQKYDHLFRKGVQTIGTIRSVSKQQDGMYATFKYEFDVGEVSYLAFMEYAQEMANFWGPGDNVPVLYDQDDPSSCCFVYR
jgi:hypothetical protein